MPLQPPKKDPLSITKLLQNCTILTTIVPQLLTSIFHFFHPALPIATTDLNVLMLLFELCLELFHKYEKGTKRFLEFSIHVNLFNIVVYLICYFHNPKSVAHAQYLCCIHVPCRSVPQDSSPAPSNQEPTQEPPMRKISLLSRPFGLSWHDRNKVRYYIDSSLKFNVDYYFTMGLVQ